MRAGSFPVAQAVDPGLSLPVRQVLVVGQSLALGRLSTPTLIGTTDAPFYVKQVNADGTLSAQTADDDEQRPALTMLRDLRAYDDDKVWAESTHSAQDTAYVAIKKGTTQYTTAMARIQDGFDAAGVLGLGHEVPSVHIIHGEKDQSIGTTRVQYAADLDEWITDYRTDIAAITGQSPIGVCCQSSSWDEYVAFPTTTLSPLDTHRTNANFYCAGPKYHLPYVADNIHLTNVGSYLLGEYHARVVQQVLDGSGWDPVAPTAISRDGAVVTVTFSVPTGPLTLDTDTLAAETDYGFSWHDDSDSASIESVEVTGASEVTVTLDTTPTGANPHLGYGVTSRGGNLRDSASETSGYDGRRLFNWCCHFYDPVPYP